MPCGKKGKKKKKGKKHRAHTPIMSQSETRFFGRELSEKKRGDGSRSYMSVAEIKRHLGERRGKKLPEKVKKKGKKRSKKKSKK